jgi:pimeloyl-ACP methyl ester carboxylesterase
VPDSYSVYFQTVSWQGTAPDLPVTYLENLRDRAVPRALQEQMIERLPFATRVIALDGGHVPSVTQPAVVAALLDGIAAGL